jgi:hypothetical protein
MKRGPAAVRSPADRMFSHDLARRLLSDMRQDTLQSHAAYLGGSRSLNGAQDRQSKGPEASTRNWRTVETGREASQRLPSYADLPILWPNSS